MVHSYHLQVLLRKMWESSSKKSKKIIQITVAKFPISDRTLSKQIQYTRESQQQHNMRSPIARDIQQVCMGQLKTQNHYFQRTLNGRAKPVSAHSKT